MNSMKRVMACLILTVFGATALSAQDGKFKLTPNVGLATTILSGGAGVQVAINPSYQLYKSLHAEGQISYSNVQAGDTFFSANEKVTAVNALVGLRVYLFGNAATTRLYTNLMIGITSYQVTNFSTGRETNTQDAGASLGLYLERKKFVVGVSFDSPEHMVLRVGFVF